MTAGRGCRRPSSAAVVVRARGLAAVVASAALLAASCSQGPSDTPSAPETGDTDVITTTGAEATDADADAEGTVGSADVLAAVGDAPGDDRWQRSQLPRESLPCGIDALLEPGDGAGALETAAWIPERSPLHILVDVLAADHGDPAAAADAFAAVEAAAADCEQHRPQHPATRGPELTADDLPTLEVGPPRSPQPGVLHLAARQRLEIPVAGPAPTEGTAEWTAEPALLRELVVLHADGVILAGWFEHAQRLRGVLQDSQLVDGLDTATFGNVVAAMHAAIGMDDPDPSGWQPARPWPLELLLAPGDLAGLGDDWAASGVLRSVVQPGTEVCGRRVPVPGGGDEMRIGAGISFDFEHGRVDQEMWRHPDAETAAAHFRAVREAAVACAAERADEHTAVVDGVAVISGDIRETLGPEGIEYAGSSVELVILRDDRVVQTRALLDEGALRADVQELLTVAAARLTGGDGAEVAAALPDELVPDRGEDFDLCALIDASDLLLLGLEEGTQMVNEAEPASVVCALDADASVTLDREAPDPWTMARRVSRLEGARMASQDGLLALAVTDGTLVVEAPASRESLEEFAVVMLTALGCDQACEER